MPSIRTPFASTVIGLFYKVLDQIVIGRLKFHYNRIVSTLSDEEMLYCYSIIMLDRLFDMTYMSMTLHLHVRQFVCVYHTSYICMMVCTYV